MAKKNLKESACYREINYDLDEFLKVLFELGFIPDKADYDDTTESDAYCWIEDGPSEADMDKVLKALGYEI